MKLLLKRRTETKTMYPPPEQRLLAEFKGQRKLKRLKMLLKIVAHVQVWRVYVMCLCLCS